MPYLQDIKLIAYLWFAGTAEIIRDGWSIREVGGTRNAGGFQGRLFVLVGFLGLIPSWKVFLSANQLCITLFITLRRGKRRETALPVTLRSNPLFPIYKFLSEKICELNISYIFSPCAYLIVYI